ncbi:ADOP family duplicated permease [Luteitalea sp.]
MSLWRHLSHGVRVLTRRASADRDLDDELAHYLEEAARDRVAQGMSPEEAHRAVRVQLQGYVGTREHVRGAGWEHAVTDVVGDLRLALRMLARQPLVSLVIVLVISLGSGAVATMYSVMNALVLRPVPGVADPETLVALQPMRRNGDVLQQTSFGRYAALRADATSVEGLAVWGRVSLTLSASGGEGVAVAGNMVSANYFDVLGVRPAAGRLFVAGEDTSPGGNAVLVVSHAYWQTHLDGDERALGRRIAVNGHPFTLIGVAPPGFRGVLTGMRPDAWVPVSMQPQLRPRSDLEHASWLWMFGRLSAGRGVGAVAGELSALTETWARDHAGADGPEAITRMHVAAFSGLPGGEGRVLLAFTGILLGAALLVLAIAGVNVATMLSARYLARQREMAVRAALGAGRTRLLRHLLTEVLVLFLLGAVGGVIVAVGATTALERLPLPANIPTALELSPDWRVLAFALVVTMASGLVCGLAPALRTARHGIAAPLRDDSTRGGRRTGLVSRALVVGQLALSLVLLVCAGLFLRALSAATHVDPGFSRTHVVAATLEPEAWGYDEPRARDFYERLLRRVEASGDTSDVGLTSRVPLMMSRSGEEIRLADDQSLSVDYISVGGAYFDALQIPLLQGRPLTRADDAAAPHVAVINETLARRAWPDGTAIGSTFRFRDQVTTVVGIARDATYASLDEVTPAFVYVPLAQVWHPTQTLLVRTRGGDAAVMREVRQAVLTLDPTLPPPRVETLEQFTDIAVLPQRAGAIVAGGLGAVGLLLATIGLYGLLAFAASRRTREIGIRVALGATRTSVLRLMIGQGLRLALAGIVVGLVLATAAARMIAPYLFSISPLDPVAFAAMSILFALVALVASFIPARRAANADPLDALRSE